VIEEAVLAIRAGRPVILPADTVYGLCTTPYSAAPVERLYRLKRRPETQPTAILASDVDMLFECVPELRGRAGRLVRALLPGPYTLVLPNPGRRFRWLTGDRPDAIGVRVPKLAGDAAAVLARVGAVAATSANLRGGPEPRTLEDVPRELREAAAAEIDGGELPGAPSTVIDFTGPEPRVLREGAGSVEEALGRAGAAAA
jgi:tRNA threonylcarbamoyl adenosine modification protein (Sua5/YciO/YrdC/YwlC family)